MSRRHGAAAWAIIASSISCSADEPAPDRAPRETDRPSSATTPPSTFVRPEVPDVGSLDRDQNRVDDLLDREGAELRGQLADATDPSVLADARARLDERIGVEAVFDRSPTSDEVDTFTRAGGVVRHVFRAVSFGFTGTLPRSAVERTARALGSSLLLLESHRRIEHHLDEATRTARARPVWAPGFAGTTGLSGTSTINIAILDTGVDASHPDLAGRMVGWKDYSSDATATPIDVDGHGTHVAGIAVGSGVSFGVGPGTLRYTDSMDISSFTSGAWEENPIHLPITVNLTSTATWVGGGSSTLTLMGRPNGYLAGSFTSVSSTSAGTSPLTLSFSGTTSLNSQTSLALTQNATRQIGRYALVNDIADYPSADDGFPKLRGVAAGSGWYGARIFPSVGPATTEAIATALDDVIVLRKTLNIKVVNASFGIGGGTNDPVLRAKANTLVANGIVFVASAGNGGRDATIGDPARAARAIAVGASNDLNYLTEYTSAGLPNPGSDVDLKPDVLAPGGSAYTSKILSVDSNSADAKGGGFPDARADDYTHELGTSMAAPFVAGAAALLIQALEQSGTTWHFDSTASPLLVKMLLLASATETNRPRESFLGNPSLGRNVLPKDRFEGYGLLNPDAAIEAATLPYAGAAFTDSTTGEPFARRAWGRKVAVPAGRTLKLTLETTASADFDLYVYGAADAKGNPSLTASATRGFGESEVLTWTAATDTEAYLFVKLIEGSGQFTLTGSTFTCGDGTLEPGEECETTADAGKDCCSSTCQHDVSGTACNDGNACTTTDSCTETGECVGEAVECPPPNECHVAACLPSTGCLSPPVSDGISCTGGTCIAGTCVRPDAGAEPVGQGGRSPADVDSGSPGPSADASLEAEPPALTPGGSGCACNLTPSTGGGKDRSSSEGTSSMAGVLALTLVIGGHARRRVRRLPWSPSLR